MDSWQSPGAIHAGILFAGEVSEKRIFLREAFGLCTRAYARGGLGAGGGPDARLCRAERAAEGDVTLDLLQACFMPDSADQTTLK